MGTMSKSKRNGVDPQAIIDQYGADTARLFMMFAAPPEQTLEWADAGVEGSHRFLKRLWAFCARKKDLESFVRKLADELDQAPPDIREARRQIHLLLKQANYDMARHQFNTVAAACMKILNALEGLVTLPNFGSSYGAILQLEGLRILLRLLSPICPHITHTLWKELGYGDDILSAA